MFLFQGDPDMLISKKKDRVVCITDSDNGNDDMNYSESSEED